MNKVILHIPHSSTLIPEEFYNRELFISKEELLEFNETITDLFTNELFSYDEFDSIIFDYSRVFCDIEKYADDSQETMSKYGMGAIYTKTNTGKLIGAVDDKYRSYVLNNIYFPYHKKMTEKVNELLLSDNVIMIDCHSFSKDIIMTEITKELPDICIGINNDDSTSEDLKEIFKNYFVNEGYTVEINYPYSGTMVPNNLKISNNEFYSIMIEINKSIYLENNRKNNNFETLKKQIQILLTNLSYYKIPNKNEQKSQADIMIEKLDKMLIERGLQPMETVSKIGSFVHIPSKSQIDSIKKSQALKNK